jgi:hypothetical protein
MQRSSTIAAITALALGLVAFQYWNAARPARNEPPLPVLVRDLPKDAKAAERMFKLRVARRFPVGSPGDAVARELAADGFLVGPPEGPWRAAALERKVFLCDIGWRVRWRAEKGKVAETDASYGAYCP